MKLSHIALAGLLVVTTFIAVWFSGHLNSAANPAQPRISTATDGNSDYKPATVSVVRPAERAFIETLRINGSLVPREEVLIAPQVEGQRIIELRADAGDIVTEGHLLARLATENLDAQVAQNQAAIQRANAAIAQAQSSIIQADAQLKEAAASLDRAKPLSKSGYLSESILDQRQATATSARAALAIARSSLKLAESEKAEAEARQQEFIWRQSRTVIHSPVAGLVLSRAAKVGAIATAAAEPMFRIAQAAEIEFEGEVTADQIHRLRPGQTVRLDIPGVEDVTGTVRLISPRVDPATRLGHVRVFIGPDQRLRVGTFAAGNIETARGSGIAVPASAVMRGEKGAYVQVVKNGNVETKWLRLGLQGDGYIEVRDGLTIADLVVAKAGTFLGNGERVTPVEIVRAAPAASEPPPPNQTPSNVAPSKPAADKRNAG